MENNKEITQKTDTPLNVVELFAGSKSFSKVAKQRGYETFTIDNEIDHDPDLCKDILLVNKSDLPKDVFILWASPPCTTFSLAGRSNNYTNFMPNNLNAALGLAFVFKTLEIIEEVKPKYWFIENPMGYLRKFPFMEKLQRKTVWYCQYGDNRAKPTDVWSNLSKWIPKKCKNENPYCEHDRAPRGSKTGTQALNNAFERSMIPEQLFNDIFDVIEGKAKETQNILTED